MYKIIATDNFDRETIADRLICDNISSEDLGSLMVDALNGMGDDTDLWFYKLVPHDYRLSRGMEDLV